MQFVQNIKYLVYIPQISCFEFDYRLSVSTLYQITAICILMEHLHCAFYIVTIYHDVLFNKFFSFVFFYFVLVKKSL